MSFRHRWSVRTGCRRRARRVGPAKDHFPQAVGGEADADVLRHRHLGEGPGHLIGAGDAALDAFVRLQRLDFLAVQPDRAVGQAMIEHNDIDMLLAGSVVAVFVVLVTQLISDIGYVYLNPRIRVS